MATSTGIFELVPITGGLGAMQGDDVLATVDVHDATQAPQGSLVKITLAQLYRTEDTAVTASTPLPDVGQAWNASGVAFTAIRLNVTDTASAVASLLLDLQVGGVSKASVRKDGLLTAANGIVVTLGGLTVTAGGVTVTAGGVTVTAGGISAAGSDTVPGLFVPLSATAAAIAWQSGFSDSFGFKWVQEEMLTGDGSLVRRVADVDSVVFNVTRANGRVTFAEAIALSSAVSLIVPGATSLSLRNHADSADNLILLDNGNATMRGTLSGVTTLTCTTLVTGAFSPTQLYSGTATVSVPDSTATTVLTLPSTQGTYLITAYIPGTLVSSSAFTVAGVATSNTAQTTAQVMGNITALAVDTATRAVKITQNTGGTLNVTVAYTRMA